MSSAELARLGAGVTVLLALTGVVLRLGNVRLGWAPVVAVASGAALLAVVGLLLRGVLVAPPAVVAALAVMTATAVRTAASRLGGFHHGGRAVLAACSTGALLTLTTVFALQVLPFTPRYLIALGGIVIGGTMTGATLAGRHLRSGLIARRDEVEAWLSVGATMRQAVAAIARQAAGEALVPALDQTRTTGLVTLPGAFIGALLAGASPTQAARFQIIVLAALICAPATVAVILVWLLGAPRQLPAP